MHLAFLPLQGCHPGTVGRGSVDTALAYHARHVGFQRLRYLELGIVVRTHLESRHSEGAGRPVRSSRPFSGKQNKISLSSGWWIKDLVEVGEQGGARPSQGPRICLHKGPGLHAVGLHCSRRHGLGDKGPERPPRDLLHSA